MLSPCRRGLDSLQSRDMDKTAPDGIWFCWLKAPMQDAMSRHVVHGCRQGEQVHWPVACTGHEEAEAEGGCPAMRQRMGLERWLLAAGLVGTRCRNGERTGAKTRLWVPMGCVLEARHLPTTTSAAVNTLSLFPKKNGRTNQEFNAASGA